MNKGVAQCIVIGVVGVFVGLLLGCCLIDSMINEHKGRLREFRKELNHLKKVGKLHIGQVVYACKYNSFYMGEITEIIHKEGFTTIELNGKETFDIGMIYTNKDEVLQQIKI